MLNSTRKGTGWTPAQLIAIAAWVTPVQKNCVMLIPRAQAGDGDTLVAQAVGPGDGVRPLLALGRSQRPVVDPGFSLAPAAAKVQSGVRRVVRNGCAGQHHGLQSETSRGGSGVLASEDRAPTCSEIELTAVVVGV